MVREENAIIITGRKVMGRNKENDYAWRKANIKRYEFTFNRTNDADVIEHLETIDNKRAYLIGLIRKDIKDAQ